MLSTLDGWKHLASGKVRDLYVPKTEHPLGNVVLMVASDRISAFDHILKTPIPKKGEILTEMSVFWFNKLSTELNIPTHFISAKNVPEEVKGRAILCKSLNMIPVECVARGYLTGSAFIEYQATGKYQEFELPVGMQDGDPFPSPIFTPAMKAAVGEHDENVTFSRVVETQGEELAHQLRKKTLEIFKYASEICKNSKITLVDTKFEFGLDENGILTLGDEVLTPDSSRYLNAHGQSFDKQYVRNYLLNESNWDKNSNHEPPELPQSVVEKTIELYREIVDKIKENT